MGMKIFTNTLGYLKFRYPRVSKFEIRAHFFILRIQTRKNFVFTTKVTVIIYADTLYVCS